MTHKVGLLVEYMNNAMVKIYLVNPDFVSGYDMSVFPITKGSMLVSDINKSIANEPYIVAKGYEVWPEDVRFVYLDSVLVGAFVVTRDKCRPLADESKGTVHSPRFFDEWYAEMKRIALDRFEFQVVDGKLQTRFHIHRKEV